MANRISHTATHTTSTRASPPYTGEQMCPLDCARSTTAQFAAAAAAPPFIYECMQRTSVGWSVCCASSCVSVCLLSGVLRCAPERLGDVSAAACGMQGRGDGKRNQYTRTHVPPPPQPFECAPLPLTSRCADYTRIHVRRRHTYAVRAALECIKRRRRRRRLREGGRVWGCDDGDGESTRRLPTKFALFSAACGVRCALCERCGGGWKCERKHTMCGQHRPEIFVNVLFFAKQHLYRRCGRG